MYNVGLLMRSKAEIHQRTLISKSVYALSLPAAHSKRCCVFNKTFRNKQLTTLDKKIRSL